MASDSESYNQYASIHQLLQELGGHNSYVNALCFDEDGSKLYSGDSLGQICIWNAYVTDKPSSRGSLREWCLCREIDDQEIKVIIQSFSIDVISMCLEEFSACSERFISIPSLYSGCCNQLHQSASKWTSPHGTL